MRMKIEITNHNFQFMMTKMKHQRKTTSNITVISFAYTHTTHLWPFRLGSKLQSLPLKRLHPPKRRPNHNPHSLPILHRFRRISNIPILQRLSCRCNCKMCITIIALGILRVDKEIIRIEHIVWNFRSNLTFVMGGIETGDRSK